MTASVDNSEMKQKKESLKITFCVNGLLKEKQYCQIDEWTEREQEGVGGGRRG